MMGKISPPFLKNHYPSVIQKDNFKFNSINNGFSNAISGMNFMNTAGIVGASGPYYYQTSQGTQGHDNC